MSFYPANIEVRFQTPENACDPAAGAVVGSEVDFTCGVSVKFFLEIEAGTKIIRSAVFKSNGCGYATAVADFLSEWITNQDLTGLHGLEGIDNVIKAEFGELPENRSHCMALNVYALENAFAAYRNLQLAGWTGEEVLICTCFGVGEQTIENLVAGGNANTVEEIGEISNAGTGCGSCQPLIREILDSTGNG